MNSGWAAASNGDLFEFPKNFWKKEITWMNGKYIAIEHTTKATVFTINQVLLSKILLIYVLQMTKCHIQAN